MIVLPKAAVPLGGERMEAMEWLPIQFWERSAGAFGSA